MIYLLSMSPLERRPSAPTLYAQVEARLLERLRSDFKPGQLLPTQQALAAEFGASLITIKRALHDLARRGHGQSTRGRGTVVTRPVLADRGRPEESLYAWLKKTHRLVPHRADEEVAARPPHPRESRFLGPDVPIVIVVRRHTFLSDGRPLEVAEMTADARQYRYRVEISKKP